MKLECTYMFFEVANYFLKLKASECLMMLGKAGRIWIKNFCLHQRAQGAIDAILGDVLFTLSKPEKTHSPD